MERATSLTAIKNYEGKFSLCKIFNVVIAIGFTEIFLIIGVLRSGIEFRIVYMNAIWLKKAKGVLLATCIFLGKPFNVYGLRRKLFYGIAKKNFSSTSITLHTKWSSHITTPTCCSVVERKGMGKIEGLLVHYLYKTEAYNTQVSLRKVQDCRFIGYNEPKT